MRVFAALSRETSCAAVSEFFSSLGWEVDSATEPSMAERFLTFRQYDAVVTDLQFNGWYCTEGLEIVRAAKRGGRNPLVALLTTSLSDESVKDAYAAGADIVWPKPQRLAVIAAQIDRSFQEIERPRTSAE
jgi:CheY-like chemotaxis protein